MAEELIDGVTQAERRYFAAEREAMLGSGKFPKGHEYEGLTLAEARERNQQRDEEALAKEAKQAKVRAVSLSKVSGEKKAAADAEKG